jgi:hypothetical protein
MGDAVVIGRVGCGTGSDVVVLGRGRDVGGGRKGDTVRMGRVRVNGRGHEGPPEKGRRGGPPCGGPDPQPPKRVSRTGSGAGPAASPCAYGVAGLYCGRSVK